MNLTLDGFFAGPNGELDWHFPLWNDEMSSYALAQLRTMDTILLGRCTYQSMSAYWPLAPPEEFTIMMNNYTKIIFSKTLKSTEWKNSRLAKENVRNEVLQLKLQPGKNIIVYGSGSLVKSLMQLDLVDEYRFWLHPVIILSGQPFFNDFNKTSLKLIRTKSFSSGVVILYYQPVKPLDHYILQKTSDEANN